MRKARYLYEISPREYDVLRLLASGLPYKIIARRLGISERRVRIMVGDMLAKTFVKSGHQLAIYAWRNRIVSIDEAWNTLQQEGQL